MGVWVGGKGKGGGGKFLIGIEGKKRKEGMGVEDIPDAIYLGNIT